MYHLRCVGDSTGGDSGDLILATGSTTSGDAGDIVFQAGESDSGRGGDVSITSNKASATLLSTDAYLNITGDNIDVVSGSGGNVSFLAGPDGTIGWGITDSDGSSATYDVRLTTNGDGNTELYSDVPISAPSFTSPSDRRIKKDFQPVDTADLLHRLQRVRITEYGYTDEWRAVRGIPDKRVRGVIAQELNEIFPEHISVLETYSLPDKGFQKTRFYRVDKQRLALDVIGGLQALHDRYSIGESTSSESGSLALTTKAAPSSGAIYLQTGRASSGESGDILVQSGAAASGNSGSISLMTSSKAKNKGDILLSTGSGVADGGCISLKAGDGENAGDVSLTATRGGVALTTGEAMNGDSGNGICVAVGDAVSGIAGDISLASGASLAGDGGRISVHAGDGGASGGRLDVNAGNGDIGGSIQFKAGDGRERGGTLTLCSGSGGEGTSGTFTIASAESSASGGILLATGTSVQGNSGDVSIATGDSAGSAGNIELCAGLATSGGGAVKVCSTGSSCGSGGSGEIIVASGQGDLGGHTSIRGSNLELVAGEATGGLGGAVDIHAGG